MAPGVDTLGKNWAVENSLPLKKFPPDWDQYGRAAGPIRNQQMADYGQALIVVRNLASVGSLDMLDKAIERNLLILDVIVFPNGKTSITLHNKDKHAS